MADRLESRAVYRQFTVVRPVSIDGSVRTVLIVSIEIPVSAAIDPVLIETHAE